jgi:hypothetical protein
MFQCEMMADEDVSFQQRAVIEFLVEEKIAATGIYAEFQLADEDTFMGASNVGRWVKL